MKQKTPRAKSHLETIDCGSNLSTIGEDAFYYCLFLSTFKCHAVTPPLCVQFVLYDINKDICVLQVPKGSVDAYKNAEQWKEFLLIEALPNNKGDANGDDAISMADANAVVNYFLAKGTSQFIDDNFDEEAADVNNDGQVTTDANQIVNMFLEGEK